MIVSIQKVWVHYEDIEDKESRKAFYKPVEYLRPALVLYAEGSSVKEVVKRLNLKSIKNIFTWRYPDDPKCSRIFVSSDDFEELVKKIKEKPITVKCNFYLLMEAIKINSFDELKILR